MSQLGDGLLVLGMHRSGTSALAGCLHHLGFALGESLMAPKEGENSRGYFELVDVFDFHERLFAVAAVSWDDPRGFDLDAVPERVLDAATKDLELLLLEHFEDATAWAVKDPRLSRTLPLWHRTLERLGADARHLIVLRHPDEVAASLAVRDGFSREKSDLLWAEHLLDAERHSRGRRRAVVDFHQLLQDPVATLDTLADRLHTAWPRRGAPVRAAVRHFLDRGLRHHRAERVEARGSLDDLLPRLHAELLSAATSGREMDLALLDDLYAQLNARRGRLQALEIEHMTQLALRGDKKTDDLVDWLERQNSDLKELRDLVEDLEEQLHERTRWLQIQDRILHDQVARIDKLERGQ